MKLLLLINGPIPVRQHFPMVEVVSTETGGFGFILRNPKVLATQGFHAMASVIVRKMVDLRGIEPLTSALRTRRSPKLCLKRALFQLFISLSAFLF